MLFTKTFALAAMVSSTLAVPVTNAQPASDVLAIAKREVLNDLAPDVAALITAIGLASLAAPVGTTVSTSAGASTSLKERQIPNQLSPELVAILNALGIPATITTPIGDILDIAGTDLKKRQVLSSLTALLTGILSGLTTNLGKTLTGVTTTVGSTVGGVTGALNTTVNGVLGTVGTLLS